MQLVLDWGHDRRRDTPAAGRNRVDRDLGVHRGGEYVVAFLANIVKGEELRDRERDEREYEPQPRPHAQDVRNEDGVEPESRDDDAEHQPPPAAEDVAG